jgi:hypothetical protein
MKGEAMKLFLSWSGPRSKAVGAILAKWIPLIIQLVQPWFSPQAIEKGAKWQLELTRELEQVNFAVVCVTPECQVAPWLLYEAGAASKNLQGRVFTVLLDIQPTEITGPLATFQHTSLSSPADVMELLRSINKQTDAPVPEAHIQQLFDVLWPQLQSEIAAIERPQGALPEQRSSEDLLSELIERTRGLERQMQTVDTRVAGLRRHLLDMVPAPMLRPSVDILLGRIARARADMDLLSNELSRADLSGAARAEVENRLNDKMGEYHALRAEHDSRLARRPRSDAKATPPG